MRSYEGLQLDSRYELKRAVDAGNFGAVYDAVDQKFDSRVAVKVLYHSSVDSAAFRSEALLARQFRHPNVVEVYEFGVDDEHDLAYIVMEFLDGCRVDELVAEPHPDQRLFCKFVDQIGSALTSAHSRGLVHRDLKPQNVMLVDRGEATERFLLLDLGVASKANARATLRNSDLDGALSPQYASPEQIEGREVDYRSDIYSFGTVLYEWLTSRPPFQSDQLLALANAILTQEPPRLIDVTDREINAEVETIILTCLKKAPELRPESIAEVRAGILSAMQPDVHPLPGVSPDPASRPAATQSTPAAAETLHPGENPTTESLNHPSPRPARNTHRQHEPVRRHRSRSRGSRTPGILIAVAVLLAASVAIWKSFPTAAPLELDLPDSVRVISGTTVRVVIQLNGSAVDSGVHLELANVPDWLHVELPTLPVTAQTIELTLRSDLRPRADSATLAVRASSGQIALRENVVVELAAPEIWVPPGFSPVGDELVRSRVHDRVVYSRISRELGSEQVHFVLVIPDGALPPFYVMRDKVWNKLLQSCASRSPERFPATADGQGWRAGALAGGSYIGIQEHPQLPVMGLNAFQAHLIAECIGGAGAHLPTVAQWDCAAGLPAYRSGLLSQTPWALGPYQIPEAGEEPGVAVGLRATGPRPVGVSADDITSSGCRDMAGNGREWTSSLMNSTGTVPDCSDHAVVRLRGRSYQAKTPLRWTDLEQMVDAVDAAEGSPTCGFRVVLEISKTNETSNGP